MDFPPTERFVNRELSLLDFQFRVLGLAENPDLPLLERIKFIAIVSQNMDEFFQVRVAGLTNQIATGVVKRRYDGLTPREQLELLGPRVAAFNQRIDEVLLDDLLPALEKEGIRLAHISELGPEERLHLDEQFENDIFPVLTPLAVDPSHPFPFISNLSLNLAVLLRDPNAEGLQFARVKVPPILSRFIVLPDGKRFVPLEQVIASHIDRLFGGQEVIDQFMFRVTRNADFAVEEEEAEDLLAAMESVLRFRQHSASAVRLEVSPRMTDQVLDLLTRELDLPMSAVFQRRTPLDLSGLWAIYGLDRPDLKEQPWAPQTQPRLAESSGKPVDLFAEIAAGDIMVHVPYESFATSTGAFLAQAAADPDVLAIKQTLYRTSVPEDPAIGGEEAIVESLIAAADAGKQVVVLVELKARFDEAANINWAKMLESAGAHVVYGVAGLKTHSKILLVVRREGGRLKRYAHVATGNYNPKTARLYEDIGIFTADPNIGADLSELFNALTGYARWDSYRSLVVAPRALRSYIVSRIREQGRRGAEGRIVFKLNHLVDPDIIDELYAASQSGCQIDLVVRGMCSLRALVPGLSDNIRVRSIVGRFLEHSRVYRFGYPEDGAAYYLGSADMMQRNLDHRVETVTPVQDPLLRRRLEEMLEVNLADDMLAWEMQPDGSWEKVPTVEGVNTHDRLWELALERARGAR